MKNVGRNDPCPCGSGKKYKKCHGATNVIEIRPFRYNAELTELHANLAEFAGTNFADNLSEIIERFLPPDIEDDEETTEVYATALSAWIILHVPVHDGQTIFEIFYKNQHRKIKNERVRKTFASWSGTVPSIFEVLSNTEETLTIQDIRTNETYKLAGDEEKDFLEGNFLIGLLLPYVQKHEFLLTILELNEVDEEVFAMLHTWNDEEIVQEYPAILEKTLAMDSDLLEMEWDNPLYEWTANIFVEHMSEKEADPSLITTGLMVWKLYTEKENPSFRNAKACAAALEYVLQREVLEISMQSQQNLADEYGVSVGTVSTQSRKMTKALAEELIVFREEIQESIEEMKREENNPPNLLTSEKAMRDIQRLLEEQDFETKEEAEAFLDEVLKNQEMISPTSLSPREIAQDKLYEAYEAKDADRKRLIKEALEIYPNSPDAYLLKAQYAKTENEQYQLYHQAVVVGEKDLGKAFFQENKGHFWLMTETRPYMRARAEFASFLHYYGETTAAIKNFEALLELNPNDNQGIRYLLLTLYLEEEQYDAAKKLLMQYKDDSSPDFLFNQALLHYFQNGITSKTKALLKEAIKQNPYVKDYLLGKKRIPSVQPSFSELGGETGAVAYVQQNLQLWERAEALVDILEKL